MPNPPFSDEIVCLYCQLGEHDKCENRWVSTLGKVQTNVRCVCSHPYHLDR